MMIKRAFTLIELLVVAAIIALAVSIILVVIRSSQLQAKDTAIKDAMFQLRNAAEMSYIQNKNYAEVCDEVGGSPGNSVLSKVGEFYRINAWIKSNNGGIDVVCNENEDSSKYAAWTPLVGKAGHYWCVDSEGATHDLSFEPPEDATSCR